MKFKKKWIKKWILFILVFGINDKDVIRFFYIKSRLNGSDINLFLVCFFWFFFLEYCEI